MSVQDIQAENQQVKKLSGFSVKIHSLLHNESKAPCTHKPDITYRSEVSCNLQIFPGIKLQLSSRQPVTFLQWLHSSSTSTVILCHGIWTHNMQNLLNKLSNVSNVSSVNSSALITIWYVNGFTTINIIPGNFQRYTPPLYYLARQCDCCQLQHAQHDMQIWPMLGHHVEGGHQCPTGHMCCCQKSLLRHSEAAARCDASHRLSAPHNSRQAGALLQEGVMSHGSHLSPHHYFQLVPQLDNRMRQQHVSALFITLSQYGNTPGSANYIILWHFRSFLQHTQLLPLLYNWKTQNHSHKFNHQPYSIALAAKTMPGRKWWCHYHSPQQL